MPLNTQDMTNKFYYAFKMFKQLCFYSQSFIVYLQVLGKDLFMVLRNKMGANLGPFIFEKVTPISGDICHGNLGIEDSILLEEMWKEIDIVLNSAAITNFDER